MTAIVFRNPGVIDPRSITTFGVSSKESPGAIGFFGTGLKYAIAVFLRLGCSVTIFSGGKQYSFGVKPAKIRVDSFDLVTMNGKPLGFTTELGKTWESWMAFRELYCNAKDEGGSVAPTDYPQPEPDETTVVVRGDAAVDAYHSRSSFILETEPLDTQEGLHVHPGSSRFVFYRGIRIMELDRPSRFTYNIQRRLDLTEDRTAKYSWDVFSAIARGIAQTERETILGDVLIADKETTEARLDYSGHLPSETFRKVTRKFARSFHPQLNGSAAKLLRALGSDLDPVADAVELTEVEAKMLARAADFAERLGFAVRTYPITVTEFLGEDVVGLADRNHQVIFLSRRAFRTGTKFVAGTLIEEFLHLAERLDDESRGMQNRLLDTVVSLGEQLTGEPL